MGWLKNHIFREWEKLRDVDQMTPEEIWKEGYDAGQAAARPGEARVVPTVVSRAVALTLYVLLFSTIFLALTVAMKKLWEWM